MSQLVFFIPLGQVDENSLVMLARGYAHIGTSKFGTYLIVPPGCDSHFRAIVHIGRYWRVMGRLFAEVGYFDGVAILPRNIRRPLRTGLAELRNWRLAVSDVPATLEDISLRSQPATNAHVP